MYSCYHCSSAVQDFELACPACAGDLRAMARINELPDVQFNEALHAARAGDWPKALRLLHAVLLVRDRDVDAWVLLGAVYARRGALALAQGCWEAALLRRPEEPQALRGLCTIKRLLNPATPPATGG